MIDYWILRDRVPVKTNSLEEFHTFLMEFSLRRVALTKIIANGHSLIRISTVFLTMADRFIDDDPPILFETMVFHGHDFHGKGMDRYCTWDEAVQGHQKMIDEILIGLGELGLKSEDIQINEIKDE